jgi:hypothetical protein
MRLQKFWRRENESGVQTGKNDSARKAFILAGQSNMIGQGEHNEFITAAQRQLPANVPVAHTNLEQFRGYCGFGSPALFSVRN